MIKSLIKKFIPSFLLGWYHFGLAFLGAVIYGFPSRKIKVIGVTGTNGKTTTASLIEQVLTAAGYKVAIMSSIKYKIGNLEQESGSKMTMPGRFKIQKFLRMAVNQKYDYMILEVTSQGIAQHRHKFINFEAAVFTNLAPEHIEAHGSFEKYREEKLKLFKATKKTHIINAEDKSAEYFLNIPSKNKFTYGLEKGDINNKDLNLQIGLLGEVNIYNALAATCVGLSQKIGLGAIRKALKDAKGVCGRMEQVIEKPRVIIDFAITPDALEKLYLALRKEFNPDKIIAVLGACGGGKDKGTARDKWKRPVLGQIANKYADEIIFTNEDPYDEDPGSIIEQIAKNASKAIKITDRREAIKKALQMAKENDLVVITGKGCESWMCFAGGKKLPWDEKRVILEEFDLLTKPRPLSKN